MCCRRYFLALLFLPQVMPTLHAAGGPPTLWGSGVESCAAFVEAWDHSRETARPYRNWFAGFISGLNLATGEDVLRGLSLEAAMPRIHIHCDDHRSEDFFNASMAVIRVLRRGGGPLPPAENNVPSISTENPFDTP